MNGRIIWKWPHRFAVMGRLRLGRALTLMHGKPVHPWTIEELAREAGLSRSALADRFMHFLGQPPMHYLAQWRMQMAAGLLSGGGASIAAIASDVGCGSEAAFSRAFKKLVGTPPAVWRRQQGTNVQSAQ
jgi:AraC-like DNA-binding protein